MIALKKFICNASVWPACHGDFSCQESCDQRYVCDSAQSFLQVMVRSGMCIVCILGRCIMVLESSLSQSCIQSDLSFNLTVAELTQWFGNRCFYPPLKFPKTKHCDPDAECLSACNMIQIDTRVSQVKVDDILCLRCILAMFALQYYIAKTYRVWSSVSN